MFIATPPLQDVEMSQTPPFRIRPDLHLNLIPTEASPLTSRYTSPILTSSATNVYSPFHSASLRIQTPYGTPVQFSPKASRWACGSYGCGRLRRVLTSRVVWFVIVIFGLICWWTVGEKPSSQTTRPKTRNSTKDILEPDPTRGLRFFPASNPKIQVSSWNANKRVGRISADHDAVCRTMDGNAKSYEKGWHVCW